MSNAEIAKEGLFELFGLMEEGMLSCPQMVNEGFEDVADLLYSMGGERIASLFTGFFLTKGLNLDDMFENLPGDWLTLKGLVQEWEQTKEGSADE